MVKVSRRSDGRKSIKMSFKNVRYGAQKTVSKHLNDVSCSPLNCICLRPLLYSKLGLSMLTYSFFLWLREQAIRLMESLQVVSKLKPFCGTLLYVEFTSGRLIARGDYWYFRGWFTTDPPFWLLNILNETYSALRHIFITSGVSNKPIFSHISMAVI